MMAMAGTVPTYRTTTIREIPQPLYEDTCSGSASIVALFDADSRTTRFEAGSVIFLDGEMVKSLYKIVSGIVRCCTYTESGQRQIFRFARPGDYLGFSDLDTWHFTAEAVNDVTVRPVSRVAVDKRLGQNQMLFREVHSLILAELKERENQIVMLAYLQSDQRVLWFLTDYASATKDGECTHLPMTRQDIGDHLGLTLETVSRAFSMLKRNGSIEMCGPNHYSLKSIPSLWAA